jgi:hypothetical protein
MQTYTFRAVSWDDEVGAALGQIEAKARAAGAVLTSLRHQVTLTPQEPPLPKTWSGTTFTVSVTAIVSAP